MVYVLNINTNPTNGDIFSLLSLHLSLSNYYWDHYQSCWHMNNNFETPLKLEPRGVSSYSHIFNYVIQLGTEVIIVFVNGLNNI